MSAETLAAEHGHYAAMAFPHDQGGEALVCECGLPWTLGEGCLWVQGAHAALTAQGGERSGEEWPYSPYDDKTIADIVHDFAVVRGDLSEQYARDQVVRIIERRMVRDRTTGQAT